MFIRTPSDLQNTFNRLQLLAVSYQLDWAVAWEVWVVPDRPCPLPRIKTPAEYQLP
ncbi:hypothetical protein [Tychonema sp. BBK16]|uniref:hypothetical protein n=1 Tax=Tychonema sp. BBK16 TaxID=2699888 RepID=UPI0030D886D8